MREIQLDMNGQDFIRIAGEVRKRTPFGPTQISPITVMDVTGQPLFVRFSQAHTLTSWNSRSKFLASLGMTLFDLRHQ